MLFLLLLCKGKYYLPPSCGFTVDLRMTIYDSEICIVLVSNDVVYLFIILLEWGGTSWCCNYCVHFTIWHLSISSSRFIWRKQHFLLNCLSIFVIGCKQKSYKCDNQLITWWTGITRPAGSCNLVTLKTNFAQYKNFVLLYTKNQVSLMKLRT